MGRGDFSRPSEGRLKPPLPDVVQIFQYSGSKTNDQTQTDIAKSLGMGSIFVCC